MQSLLRDKAELSSEMRAALLTALACKREKGSEIAVFAKSILEHADPWPLQTGPPPAILGDTCGTGGDDASLLNISTLAAILLASLNIPIAKHGNRSVSSKSGSADLIEKLGISLELSHSQVAKCLQELGITFLYAPLWHSAMRHAVPVRKLLGVRTLFNLLGPLCNPAPISHQIIGVFESYFQEQIAEASALLQKNACILCSEEGLDEVSPEKKTSIILVSHGSIQARLDLGAKDFGLTPQPVNALRISGPEESLERSLKILQGHGSPAENTSIVLNAALLYHFIHYGTLEGTIHASLKDTAALCNAQLRSGSAFTIIEQWRQYSQACREGIKLD